MMKGIEEESDDSRKILDAIYNFRFDDNLEMYESVSNFRLIQDSNYIDVFVQADIEAVEVWERYKREVLSEKNFKKRQENYLRIKRDFRSYIISVPQKFAKEFIKPTENSSILLLPYENLKDYYSEDTGFNRNMENLIIMM
jgi:CRISPR-associated endonuclease/helicase Cas3